MKQNVVMIRKLGDFEVGQRTKDGMFNGTLLLKQWNTANNSRKEIKEYFENKSTKEFIETMINDESVIGGIVPMIKSRANKGDNAGTWMHPYLFIDFAMWINPKFKLKVIKFVYDELIKVRHDAGDKYVLLSASLKKLDAQKYSEVATALQWIVYRKKGKDLRQKATEQELIELAALETKFSWAIDMGFITTHKQLMGEMRKEFKKKHLTTPF
jgi:hypothetical protein